MAEIDLVCPWVDGSDPAWQAERNRYASAEEQKQTLMWRDWGLMRYWFRGVERALPWIRKVHFVTWGHLPAWLNTEHPKLHVVRHDAYLPKEYLPTFSGGPIALNVHRIEGLAEQFIYANDDYFFIDRLEKEEFFQKGLPCDFLQVQPITEIGASNYGYILWNNISCLNEYLNLSECLKQNEALWFHPAYPSSIRKFNEIARHLKYFPGFAHPHLPQAMLKSTYEEVWKKARPRLHFASKQKFRSWSCNSDLLMRDWQLATGKFTPYMRRGKYIALDAPKEELKKALLSTKHPIVCLNEGEKEVDFLSRRSYVQALFQRVLPEKSAFEKD